MPYILNENNKYIAQFLTYNELRDICDLMKAIEYNRLDYNNPIWLQWLNNNKDLQHKSKTHTVKLFNNMLGSVISDSILQNVVGQYDLPF